MAEPLLADPAIEPECLCGHPKFEHRLGKKGCRNMDCAFGCDRYTPQDVPAAPKPVDLDEVVAAAEQADEPAPLVEEPAVADVESDAVPEAEPEAAPWAGPDSTAAEAVADLADQLAGEQKLRAYTETERDAARREAQQTADELAQQTTKLVAARQERDHAQRLITDAWEALAAPGSTNLSAGILTLRRDCDALVTETGELRDRLTAALDRADAADARIRELEAAGIDLLLARAEGYDLPRVASASAGVRGAVDILRMVLDTADTEVSIRSEIGDLQAALDAARFRLQAVVGTETTRQEDPADDGKPPWWPLPAPARLIREWAYREKLPVSSKGVPAKDVVDAYIAAHPVAADA